MTSHARKILSSQAFMFAMASETADMPASAWCELADHRQYPPDEVG